MLQYKIFVAKQAEARNTVKVVIFDNSNLPSFVSQGSSSDIAEAILELYPEAIPANIAELRALCHLLSEQAFKNRTSTPWELAKSLIKQSLNLH